MANTINTMTAEQMVAEIARLTAANAAAQAKLDAQANRPLSVKVSQKGAVSVYGLGRWPVTLYQSQMNKLLDHADAIRAFMVANQGKLKVKGEVDATAEAPATVVTK